MAQLVTATSDRSKKTALKLCCLGFIGIGGLHYFYVGKFGKGLLYLFTAGLLLFGTAKDLVKIRMGQFVDSTGAPLKEE